MTSLRTVAASRKISSNSPNPFDSDDESASAPSLPRPSKTSSSDSKYSNPFDDDLHSQEKLSSDRTRNASGRPKHTSTTGYEARNPFDDDAHEPLVEKPKDRSLKTSLDNGTLFLDDFKPSTRADNSLLNPFDDNQDLLANHEERKSSRTERSQRKGRVTSVGEGALKKAQKLKEIGANQAQKLVEGGFNQVQRSKESSYGDFKSTDGNGGPKPSKSKQSYSGNPQARDHLLADDGESYQKSSSSSYATTRARYSDNILQSGDLESRSVQELQDYAVHKSEETTDRIQNCLKVAEDIKGDATRTLLTLHEQGEQIRRTHEVAVEIDQNLSTGEKLLGSLGGIFSKTWKPKKTRTITGPVVTRNDSFKRRGHHLEQRVALGLIRSNSKGRTHSPSSDFNSQPQQQTVQAKLDVEKRKQDDALSDLSNVLGQLKEMSIDMGSEVSRQNEALDGLQDDVVELGERVKGANARGRRLLGR